MYSAVTNGLGGGGNDGPFQPTTINPQALNQGKQTTFFISKCLCDLGYDLKVQILSLYSSFIIIFISS